MAIRIALAGNPNCGKTTMFNNLTGSNQYVGNWPGVTVEKKEGKLKGKKDIIITDLPGIYSLSPYTLEEVVSRDYLINERPDAIINLVDATNLERNLYLTTQLLELGIPVVIALNMMDLAVKSGDKIDEKKLAAAFGCEVVATSALKGEGLTEVVDRAVRLANAKTIQVPKHEFSREVEGCLADIADLLPNSVPDHLARWYSIKLFEQDEKVLGTTPLSADSSKRIVEIVKDAEKQMDDDAESIITNERYEYISKIITGCLKKNRKGMTVSDKIDRIVTNRILALPIFVAVMFVVYYVSVTSLGTIVTDFTNDTLFGAWIQPAVQGLMETAGASEWLVSLVVDGIIGGLAAPIGFAPQMAILFLFLSVLEDCGYMARVAFIMDRIFRRFGLSGKSFIPLLISSGCGVPAIMATKTIEDDKNRRMTIMTSTFVPCGAKLPVIALVAGAIMGGAWWMAPSMYFIGIASVIVSCIILKKTKMFAGDPSPFVIELPQYHVPSVKTVLLHVWERVWSFLKKAGTILFLCCMVMWFLATFGVENGAFGMVEDMEASFLAIIGTFLAPIFAPLGFGSWQAVASSLSGFVAKEGIVSTMGVLANMAEATETDAALWQYVMTDFFHGSALAGFTFLTFNLLDSPCLAAISTMAKEMGNKGWTAFAVISQNVFAYAVCLMIYQLGSFAMGGGFGIGTAVAVIVLAAGLYLLFRPAPGAGKKAETAAAGI
ncbi:MULTISPECIES: ferrous iron transport protein B [Hungatella]|uniref:Ferrous iron transport protein B n=2 Tax=Hungatella hathewayi TaxID=154046 RepID=A0AA37JQS6_9FIRM|nr:ferrous iron transport protein B [Hungatella hathewayi]MBT9798959.1 ferrous iron transport protein B [Hungatella hathewayi]GKH02985.1 ferrous iron transport protein B [Hungatella hathewayi]GKH08935.1 ferrous iron transport protein B [Hungatella hathewayi]